MVDDVDLSHSHLSTPDETARSLIGLGSSDSLGQSAALLLAQRHEKSQVRDRFTAGLHIALVDPGKPTVPTHLVASSLARTWRVLTPVYISLICTANLKHGCLRNPAYTHIPAFSTLLLCITPARTQFST